MYDCVHCWLIVVAGSWPYLDLDLNSWPDWLDGIQSVLL